jgi:hypothetical protein
MNYPGLFETVDDDIDAFSNNELFDMALNDKLTEITTVCNSTKSSDASLNTFNNTGYDSSQVDHLNLLSLSNELAKFYNGNGLPSPEYIHNSLNFSFSPSPRQSIVHDNINVGPAIDPGVVGNGGVVPNTLDSTRPTIGESIGHTINQSLGQSLDHQMGYIDEQMDPQIDQYVSETLEGGLVPENGLSQTSNPTESNASVPTGPSDPNSANGAPGVDGVVEPTINPRQLFSRLPQSVSSPALSTLFGSKRYTSVPKLPDQSKAQFEVNDKVNLKMNDVNDVNNWYGINMNWAIDENKTRSNNSFGVNYDMSDIPPLTDQMIISDNNLNDLGISPTIKMPLPTIKQGRSQSLSSPVMSHMNALLRRNSIATPDILKKKRRKSNDLSALNTNLSPVNHHIRSRGNSVASISKSSGTSSSTKDNMSISASAALNNQLSPVNSSYNQPHQQDGSSSGSGSSSNQYPPVTSFPCTECDKQFKRSEHLKRHIRSVHSNIRPFHCKYCEKKFSRSDNLAQHLKTHYRTDANGNPTIVYGNPNNQRKSKK